MKKLSHLFFAMFVVMTMISAVFFNSCKHDIKSVTLNKTTLTLDVGESETLKLSVEPKDLEYTATWESSNKNVVTVDNKGKVTAVSSGTATITATVENKKATCKITVNNSPYYIEYDGKIYGMANGFWEIAGLTTWNGINYSQITIASKEVKYNSFMNDIVGTGNGIKIIITHTDSFTSISGNKTYIFGDSGEPDHIFSAWLLLNHDFWSHGLSNAIKIESGTLKLSTSASTYTLDFTGQDDNGKSIKMHYVGTLEKLNSSFVK